MNLSVLSRVSAAILLGAATTTVVVLIMQSLIASDRPELTEPPPGATLDFVRLDKPDDVDVKDRTPPEPPQPPTQPPPELQRVTFDGGGGPVGPDVKAPDVSDPGGPGNAGMADGDALPVVKVQPVYPEGAARRGVEGYVLVEFTIDELGRVHDVSVVEAEPRGVFERAAVRAAEQFRYKPRVVNGEATPVSGVKNLITFELGS